ncbi:LysE family translocator, partial [Pseudomonas aeruginosa]|uniref:LysE family translocator n=1 Tax=Pseudomonas aeruginosa TaxID=287 RepID=UPI0021563009
MQELSVLLTLAAVFAVALVSPGPDVALVVRTSLHQGRRAGLASALGLACGILLHTTLVLTGVSLLLSRTPVLFALSLLPIPGPTRPPSNPDAAFCLQKK